MIRRLTILLLTLACALAPALPGLASDVSARMDCCCQGCPACPPSDCVPPAPAPVRVVVTAAAAVEQDSVKAKAAAGTLVRVLFQFCNDRIVHLAAPSRATVLGIASAGSAALYEAHCSLLI
jgi:hypothetical protein